MQRTNRAHAPFRAAQAQVKVRMWPVVLAAERVNRMRKPPVARFRNDHLSLVDAFGAESFQA